MSKPLNLEVVDHCLVMTLNRPERRNAINRELGELMVDALTRLDEDPRLRAGVLAGNGPSFCAGMDLKDFAATGVPRGLFQFVRRGSRKPLVAAVHGQAYAGGLEIALTCDIVVASASATFAIPEVQRGLIAGAGGLFRLPRKAGPGLASLMALTGDPIDVHRAERAGLVSIVVDADADLTTVALQVAGRMAAQSPIAVRTSKKLMELADSSQSFEEYWALQWPIMLEVAAAPDSKEGPLAFVEKRDPVWTTG